MRRRAFLALLGGLAVAWPLAAPAQQRDKPVVGILSMQTQATEASRLEAIVQGLKETGFVDGRNLAIDYRFAEGRNDRLPVLAAELVRRPVAVIVANTTPPAHAAKAATTTIPVEVGLVASFNRSGANVTGVTFLVNKLVGKRLELLCEVVPKTAPVGMLADRLNPNAPTDVRDAQAAAATLGRTLHVVWVAAPSDLEGAFAELVQHQVAALFVAPNANFRIWRQPLLALAERYALPASFSSIDFVPAGGLMSYSPDQQDSYREVGTYAGRILKGEKPGDLPVMQSTKFEFSINLKTASTLGLAIPANLLVLATELFK